MPALEFMPSGDDAADIAAPDRRDHRPDRRDDPRRSRRNGCGFTIAGRRSATSRLMKATRMSTRQRILDQLFFGRDPLKDFPARHAFATDLQGWHSQHPYLTRAIARRVPPSWSKSACGKALRRHHGQGDATAESGRGGDRHRHLAGLVRTLSVGEVHPRPGFRVRLSPALSQVRRQYLQRGLAGLRRAAAAGFHQRLSAAEGQAAFAPMCCTSMPGTTICR